MIKYPILLIILLIIPFFIIPVNGAYEKVTNGGFETGDLTGWDTTGSLSITTVQWSWTAYCDTYFMFFNIVDSQSRIIEQDVDFTNANYLNFSYWAGDVAGASVLYAYVDNDLLWSYNWGSTGSPTGVWWHANVDVSTYTGTLPLKFVMSGSTSFKGGMDCISVLSSIPAPPLYNTINYNPDIPVSNVKPFNLSYTLNATYADNPLYPCFIYSYRGTDISSNDTPHIIWLSSYEGYVNLASGNFVTSNYFHHYDWTELNRSYGVVLYNPNDRTSGYINFDTIENDPNFLAKDQIYVNYSYNKTPPSPPLPQPTPNMTAIPTPSGTPTPQPTATPQPDPESINESLNTSFKQGYSNLVNTTIDGFYEPVYNFTYYIASPLLGINDTLYNFSTHMNESFTNSSSSLILSSSILFLIMTNIPDKLINVMTYYLIWLIVLLIFKGDA